MPPTGARGLNSAASDIYYLYHAMLAHYQRGDDSGWTATGQGAGARVWKAQLSWWMTSIPHTFPAPGRQEAAAGGAGLPVLQHSRAALAGGELRGVCRSDARRRLCHGRRCVPPLTLLAALALASCSTTGQEKAAANTAGAVTTPLTDLNLVQANIPELLQQAAHQPYRRCRLTSSCDALAAAIKQWTRCWPRPRRPQHRRPRFVDRAGDEAGDAATGGAEAHGRRRDPAAGSWLSGAERYSKQCPATITAGGVRRGS